MKNKFQLEQIREMCQVIASVAKTELRTIHRLLIVQAVITAGHIGKIMTMKKVFVILAVNMKQQLCLNRNFTIALLLKDDNSNKLSHQVSSHRN